MTNNKYADFAERLTKLIDSKGTSIKEISDMTDINYEMVRRYANGMAKPREDKMRLLADYLETSIAYLDYGNGTMDKRSKITVFERDEPANDVIQRLTTSGADSSPLISIPYLDARAACGLTGKVNGDKPEVLGRYEISEEFLARLGLPTTGEGLILIEADGDSMMPSIPNKTPLLVNTKESDFSSLVTGKVYVFCADGEMLCKRIYRNLDSTITLKSDNHEMYDDVTVNKEKFNEFHLLGRVKFAFVEM